MQHHKFVIGQIVTVRASAMIRAPAGRYEIMRRLPADQVGPQYRVKAVNGGQEWMLGEADLA